MKVARSSSWGTAQFQSNLVWQGGRRRRRFQRAVRWAQPRRGLASRSAVGPKRAFAKAYFAPKAVPAATIAQCHLLGRSAERPLYRIPRHNWPVGKRPQWRHWGIDAVETLLTDCVEKLRVVDGQKR